MYSRQEWRDTSNDVYLANFTTGTPMHYGICSRIDSVLDERKLLSHSKDIKIIICPLFPTLSLRAAQHIPLPRPPLALKTLMASPNRVRK